MENSLQSTSSSQSFNLDDLKRTPFSIIESVHPKENRKRRASVPPSMQNDEILKSDAVPGQQRHKTPKINLSDPKWTKKPLRRTSKYAPLYEQLLENGKETELWGCKKCPYYTHKHNYGSLRNHKSYHLGSVQPLEAQQEETSSSMLAPTISTLSNQCKKFLIGPQLNAKGLNLVAEEMGEVFRLRCISHILSTIALRTTKPYPNHAFSRLEMMEINKMDELLTKLGSFVVRAKENAEIDHMASLALKEPISNRCLPNWTMVKAFLAHQCLLANAVNQYGDIFLREQMTELLENDEEFRAYTNIFEPFVMSIKRIEMVSTKPTINLVLVELASLELHLSDCIDSGTDAPMQRTMARAALAAMKRKLERSINRELVCAAAYLDPTMMRRMQSIEEKVPTWKMEDCKQAINTLSTHLNSWGNREAQHPVMDHYNDPYPEFPMIVPTSNLNSEMRVYEIVAMTVDPQKFDLLEFWRGQTVLPKLRRLAAKIFPIPASSMSEPTLSKLRRIKSETAFDVFGDEE